MLIDEARRHKSKLAASARGVERRCDTSFDSNYGLGVVVADKAPWIWTNEGGDLVGDMAWRGW